MLSKDQLTSARKGISPKMKRCRIRKPRSGIHPVELPREPLAPANIRHENPNDGRNETKINANRDFQPSSYQSRIEKLLGGGEIVRRHGLMVGDDLENTRRQIILHSTVPIGTVPIYELACQGGNDQEIDFSRENILSVIRSQAEQGVDYMTIHAGIRPEQIPAASRRKLRIVSRGGALIARYMVQNHCDNPFYNCFDDILEICAEYDVTLSLGDGMRPGCLADASDDAQFAELAELGRLGRRCREAGVQVMIEGPGHIPMHEIEMNMKKEQELCDDAPFYILLQWSWIAQAMTI